MILVLPRLRSGGQSIAENLTTAKNFVAGQPEVQTGIMEIVAGIEVISGSSHIAGERTGGGEVGEVLLG